MARRRNRRHVRIAPPRSKNCSSSGPPTATRHSSPSKNSSKKSRWPKKPSIARSRKSCPTTSPPGRWCPMEGAEPGKPARPSARARGRRARLAQRTARPHPPPLEAAARRQHGALPDDRRRNSARRRTGHLDAVQSPTPAVRAPQPRKPPAVAASAAQQQWPSIVSQSDVPRLRRSGPRVREVQRRHRLDAEHRAHRQEHLCVAGAAEPQYGRHIGRLDEIPDEELATLAHRGINSLWLIGVWERSRASKTIKQLCGNRTPSPRPTRSSTTASPTISAANRPTSTCAIAPITTASASPATWCPTTWASIRPGWSSIPSGSSRGAISPYPAYSFDGPDLSHDGRVEIKIEDHYFEQTDAAVVFRAAIAHPARPATSITATTAPAFRGTTPRSSTT